MTKNLTGDKRDQYSVTGNARVGIKFHLNTFLNLSGLTRNAKLVRELMRSTTIDQNQFQPHFLEFVGYDILHLHSRKVSPRNEETY